MLQLHATQPLPYQSTENGVPKLPTDFQAKVNNFSEIVEKQVTVTMDQTINMEELSFTYKVSVDRSVA